MRAVLYLIDSSSHHRENSVAEFTAEGITNHFATVFGLGAVGGLAYSVAIVDLLHIGLFYGSISLSYLITYSAIEGDSPTLSLVRFVWERRATGVPADDVIHFLAQRPFVKARLAALVASGLIFEQMTGTSSQEWDRSLFVSFLVIESWVAAH
jgi:hypothetical protein